MCPVIWWSIGTRVANVAQAFQTQLSKYQRAKVAQVANGWASAGGKKAAGLAYLAEAKGLHMADLELGIQS